MKTDNGLHQCFMILEAPGRCLRTHLRKSEWDQFLMHADNPCRFTMRMG